MKQKKTSAILAQQSPFLLGIVVFGYLGYYAIKNGIPISFEYQGAKMSVGQQKN